MPDSELIDKIAKNLQVIMDIEEIRKLKARYISCSDCDSAAGTPGRPEEMEALFTEDGVWDGRPFFPLLTGSSEIAKWVRTDLRETPFLVHNVFKDNIEVDGDNARGTWQFLVISTIPDQRAVWMLGNYDERYVRTEDGWRIKHLRAHIVRSWEQEGGWTGGLI